MTAREPIFKKQVLPLWFFVKNSYTEINGNPRNILVADAGLLTDVASTLGLLIFIS